MKTAYNTFRVKLVEIANGLTKTVFFPEILKFKSIKDSKDESYTLEITFSK